MTDIVEELEFMLIANKGRTSEVLHEAKTEIERMRTVFAKYEMCPVCGQHDNVGECTHEPGGVSIARIIWSDDIFANIDFGLVRELTDSTVKVLKDKGLM